GGAPRSEARITPDGRYVAFVSARSDLVANDTNGRQDVFELNTQTLATTRWSVSSTGVKANGDSDQPAISDDGSEVAFTSTATNLAEADFASNPDVYERSVLLSFQSTKLVSSPDTGVHGNGSSSAPSVSGDGRFVAFTSDSKTLVPNDTNNASDVF